MTSQAFTTSRNTYSMDPFTAETLRRQLKTLREAQQEAQGKADRARKPENESAYIDQAMELASDADRLETALQSAPPQPIEPEWAIDMMIGDMVRSLGHRQGQIRTDMQRAMNSDDPLYLMDEDFLERSTEANVRLSFLTHLATELKRREEENKVDITPADVATVLTYMMDELADRIMWEAAYSSTSTSSMRNMREQAEQKIRARIYKDLPKRSLHRWAEMSEVWAWMQQNPQ